MQGAKIASLESRSSLDGKVMDGVSLPEHWRKRWLGPLQGEQVEIGPLLGRGGYGKVYKGVLSFPASQPALLYILLLIASLLGCS